ncbi:MAG TPA: PPOX class F420-dependent oxidoreductase [Acidimicrobiales bacterium]|nr:PPOX class F420-dependent oxidoreductase [Acidimicrobiales bacterium]
MDLAWALEHVRPRHQAALVTIHADGRPQLTHISYAMDAAGTVRISITDTRVKTRNLRRDPRALLHVAGDNFWDYVVLDGTVELSAVAAEPHDGAADELVEVYRAIGGEHPDWEEYRRVMTQDRRLVARFRAARAYGVARP